MKAVSGIKNTFLAVILAVLVVLSSPVNIVSLDGAFSSGETDKTEKKIVKRTEFIIKATAVMQYVNCLICILATQK